MSDERSSAGDSDTESDVSKTGSASTEPGGGPERVVSDKSVDDILNSLNETKPADSDDEEASVDPVTETDESTTRTQLDGDYVETAPDDDRSPSDDGDTDDTAPKADAQARSDSSAESTATDDRSPAAAVTATDREADALADRIEDGTVTGADVRAAEAGEGREKTSDIGDIELTMDDLEATESTTGSNPTTPDPDGDAGPLAGSIEPESTASAADEDDDTDQSTGGLFSRLKARFF